MSQEKVNLRLRMTRRLAESLDGSVQCEKCSERFSPLIRIGAKRMINNWFICPKCNHGEDL